LAELFVSFVIISVAFHAYRKLQDTSLLPLSRGLGVWALAHEGFEMVNVFSLMIMSSLFYPAFQIFGRGACIVGPIAVLIGAAYVYVRKRGADFWDMILGISIGFGFLVSLINAIWSSAPATALGIGFYTPVILAFILSAVLLYKAGVHSNWVIGLLAMGFGHELPEAAMFHGMAIKILRGADPAAVPKSAFLVFLGLQLIGPIILWYQSRKE